MDNRRLNRPPRTKRPPEVVRHVDESIDAMRRVQAARGEKPAAPPAPRPKP
jgi:hypothetical protein